MEEYKEQTLLSKIGDYAKKSYLTMALTAGLGLASLGCGGSTKTVYLTPDPYTPNPTRPQYEVSAVLSVVDQNRMPLDQYVLLGGDNYQENPLMVGSLEDFIHVFGRDLNGEKTLATGSNDINEISNPSIYDVKDRLLDGSEASERLIYGINREHLDGDFSNGEIDWGNIAVQEVE